MTTPAIYHLDFETFSPESLKDVGAFKYAAHPEAEILVMAIAKNDDVPLVWSTLQKNDAAVELLKEAIRTGAEIWAHNAQFEFAISKHLFAKTFGMQPPALTQWRCTAALCRLAAIPSSLAQAGEFLGIDMPKDKAGAKLINQFCLADRIHPAEAPLDFHAFVEYCRRDVEAERQIHKSLHWLTQQPHPNPAHFQADLRMNDRGIPLNIDALRHAEKLISDYTEKLIPIFRSQVAHPTEVIVLPVTKQRKAPKRIIIPFGFDPSQGEMMRAWLKTRGFTGADLQADTVSAWLTAPLVDQLTPEAVTALSTYALIGSAAVKKIPAMLKMADDDGKVRGALLIYGAERTHRWTGRGIQPQNFARPTIEFSDLAYACLCAGATLEELEALFGDLFPIMVSIIRNFIQPPGGQMVLQADYSAIEARVAPWLVGEEKTLQAFRNNEPIYENMASSIFGKPTAKVTKAERFVGKQAVLGCSYSMGKSKFRGTCESYGFTPTPQMIEDYKPRHAAFIDGKDPQEMGWKTVDPQTDDEWASFAYDDLADRAVSTWRSENPKVVASWKQIELAAKAAIERPKSLHKVGKLVITCTKIANFMALCICLPSGHMIIYPKVEVVSQAGKWSSQIRFWGVMPNTGGKWGWCYTYGGKLLENATQAAAGDIMREGMLAAERAGYQPFMLVHDEILCCQLWGQTHEELCQLLCTMPNWAHGLPLAAEGATIPHYKK